MPVTPFPYTDPTLWDTIEVDDVLYTLLAEFDGEGLKRKVDRRHASGSNGARIRNHGLKLAVFTMTLTAWLPEHFGQLDVLIATLIPRNAATANRDDWHTIAHPVLAQVGITRIYSEDIGLLRRKSPGVYEQKVKLTEYNPPPTNQNVTRAPTAPSGTPIVNVGAVVGPTLHRLLDATHPFSPANAPPSTPTGGQLPIAPPSQTSTGPRQLPDRFVRGVD